MTYYYDEVCVNLTSDKIRKVVFKPGTATMEDLSSIVKAHCPGSGGWSRHTNSEKSPLTLVILWQESSSFIPGGRGYGVYAESRNSIDTRICNYPSIEEKFIKNFLYDVMEGMKSPLVVDYCE